MLRSINISIADVSRKDMSVCHNAIRDNTLSICYQRAPTVFDYATYLVFQGLTSATYINVNSTGSAIDDQVPAMINTAVVDTTCIPAERCFVYKHSVIVSVALYVLFGYSCFLVSPSLPPYDWRSMTPERVSDFGMTLPFGFYTAGLIRRMPNANGVNLSNFDGLRAGIDRTVYAMFILCALVLVVLYSIACYAKKSTSTHTCVELTIHYWFIHSYHFKWAPLQKLYFTY